MSLVQLAPLILKRASASRSSGEWSDDDYDVLADGVVVGRIMKAAAKPADASPDSSADGEVDASETTWLIVHPLARETSNVR